MALTSEQKDRLASLRNAKADWAKVDADKADELELERLEHEASVRALEAKFTSELGKPGVSWALVDSLVGPVVVKVGDAVCYTKFISAVDAAGSLHLADAQDFILPNLVYPTRDEYMRMCGVAAGLPILVAPPLARLYRGEREVAAGK